MEEYPLLDVGHRWAGVVTVSLEYILHKCRGKVSYYSHTPTPYIIEYLLARSTTYIYCRVSCIATPLM